MTLDTTSQKRSLGRTHIKVTPIGLGGNKFSGGKGVFRFIGPILSQEEVNEIVKAALDGGINWFDTAEMYGGGHSEKSLAGGLRAAGKADGQAIIATKWSPFFRTAGNIPRTIDVRCRMLDDYTIDLYMVHNPMSFSSPESEMAAMADLVEAGKIRSVGVSNFNVKQMRRAHSALEKRGLPLAVNQLQYSLLNRNIESNGVLAAAKELGITIIAWAPLGSGVLTGKYHKDPERLAQRSFGRRMMLRRHIERSRPLVEALEEIATRYETTPAQVAVNWLVNFQGETVVAIPGASKVHHAEQSAGAMTFKLSDADMVRLDELSAIFR
jgi:aryl-alcohol dehydrogenase-like predicted oxidoreductase